MSMAKSADLAFDSRGVASLDGIWDFMPGDHALAELGELPAEPIEVPGLWETQGHLELDGIAWYRRRFRVDDITGHWTLRFGAVMDLAEVFLNGVALGSHESPFTPFEVDADAALVAGENTLTVRVTDPSLHDPEHLRLAHGKQGWANHVFPSRPSLYMTYGGIWQSVTLRRHGPLVIDAVFVNADPDDLVVNVEVHNRGGEGSRARVGVRTLGRVLEIDALVPGRGCAEVSAGLGSIAAARWSPDDPVLHDLVADVRHEDTFSDMCTTRYGLRTVRVEGKQILVNDEPYRMKSVLVQGFTADKLYAEADRASIEHEVRAAIDMGFNTLRLHIKAFDPTYLDVCDELGVFLHCDLPVAEPIAHEEMGVDGVLVRRCVAAITEQVRRDRNHPSIILWSAMNELCDGRWEARQWDSYERFARTLVAAVNEADGTRPVIENDWIEPDPDRIFASPIVTAHWYGQLHADYLDKIERASRKWSGMGRPFFVSEFGDWGLPEMPLLPDPPFWDTRETYAAGLTGTLWPSTVARFVTETQRYQGLSDRLQTEVWRRHDDIGGYCLTELTDVPHELNGLLDLHRRPKKLAVAETTRANQKVLPMLELDSLVASAGQLLRACVHVANDGPALSEVVIEARFGDSASPLPLDRLLSLNGSNLDSAMVEDRFGESVAELYTTGVAGYRATSLGELSLAAPAVPGSHDLVLRLWAGGVAVAENRYPVHVVDVRPVDKPFRTLGPSIAETALRSVGAATGDTGPVVVGEGALDGGAKEQLVALLAAGETVLVLAQPPDAAPHFPTPVSLEPLVTAWGSTVFHFTTDNGALPCLPRRNVLVAEDSTIQATTVVASIAGERFPDTPVVIAYKPVPGAITGTIVGSHPVGAGQLIVCQYRLCERVLRGDAAARALLADLLRWASVPRPVLHRQARPMADGRSSTSYTWTVEAAR